MLTATYLINRAPTKILQGKTLYEVLFKTAPSYNYINIFGPFVLCINIKGIKINLSLVAEGICL